MIQYFKDAQEFPGGLAVKDSALSLMWLDFDPGQKNKKDKR